MIRRTQTIYVTLDPFLSPRGAVLHHFDQFLAGLAEAEFPCIWLTSLTRAQVDESRRRLGHNEPFIGESGCGVYLPEDYFHLKSGNTIRLGRFTCIPIAKPQPAAAEALEELSTDVHVSAVSLRSLSLRELSQNTGLPAREAEQIRMRDFDELFFFAGTSDSEIVKFAEEAKLRGLVLQNVGSFWSLSCGADLAKCIRELGGLYDRALRGHALRTGVAAVSTSQAATGTRSDPRLIALSASCDRTLHLFEGPTTDELRAVVAVNPASEEPVVARNVHPERENRSQPSFSLRSPDVWDDALAAILSRK
jgi:predicted mannosyl-3-phosphoglycerate phosphatase (HAD superfamily)